MKPGFPIVLLISAILHSPLAAYSDPLDTLKPGQWYEVPNSQMQDVSPEPFDSRVKNVMEAWSGGAFDTNRNRLLVWGGGHGDYWGNEIYAFNVDTLTWQRLNDPYGPAKNMADGTHAAWFPDNTPGSRHTYDGIEYIPGLDIFWGVGGSLWKSGSGTQQTIMLKMSTLEWSEKTRAPIVGTIGVASGYDPVTKKIYVHDLGKLLTYDPFADVWNTLSQVAGDNGLVGEVDPVHRKFVIVGKGSAYVYDLSASTITRSPLGATGNNAMEQTVPGLAFDPVSEKIVAWDGGVYVYTLDLSVSPPEWTRISPASDNIVTPTSGSHWGTYGRWRYVPSKGVFIGVNRTSENVYFYKLGTDPGTGDNPSPSLPEVNFSAIPATIEAGGNVTLTWTTLDADSCNASGSLLWSGAKSVTNASGETVGPLSSDTIFTLTCENSGGSTQRSVTVGVVALDTQPPEIVGVNVSANGKIVQVVTSEAIEKSGAENIGNYSIDNNVSISLAVLENDLHTVSLTTSGLSENTNYTLTVNNLLDRAAVPNSIAANSQFGFTYISPSGNSDISPVQYQWDVLQVSKKVYIDRDYTFTNVPPSLENLDYIKTANGDKFATQYPFLSFSTNKDVTVYVAYDMRNNPLPDWLASWVDSGLQLDTTDVSFQLYKKNYTSGLVQLGANEKGNSMYVVLVGDQNETPNPNPQNPSDSGSGGLVSVPELILLFFATILIRIFKTRFSVRNCNKT